MRRTLLAVGIAVVVSMLIAPHGDKYRVNGWGPFFYSDGFFVPGRGFVSSRPYSSGRVNIDMLALQTVFLAVLAAVLVNLRKSSRRGRERSPTEKTETRKEGRNEVAGKVEGARGTSAMKCHMCGQEKESVRSRTRTTVGLNSGVGRWEFCDECAATLELAGEQSIASIGFSQTPEHQKSSAKLPVNSNDEPVTRTASRLPVVMLVSGGPGAGKTHSIKEPPPNVEMIWDDDLRDFDRAMRNVDLALRSGRNVRIVHIERDIEDAFRDALKRASYVEAKRGSARIVPIKEHVDRHVAANQTIRRLVEHYADEPRVHFSFINNTARAARPMSVKTKTLSEHEMRGEYLRRLSEVHPKSPNRDRPMMTWEEWQGFNRNADNAMQRSFANPESVLR